MPVETSLQAIKLELWEKKAFYANIISGSHELQPFPYRYYVREERPGERFLLRAHHHDPFVVQVVGVNALAVDLLNYQNLLCVPCLRIDEKIAMDIANFYMLTANPAPSAPASVSFKNEKRLTYKKLDFNFENCGPTPIFDEFLSRTNDPHAFIDFIGSLFFEDSDRQQYLWMFGAGGDGKGAVLRFLAKIFEDAVAWETCDAASNQFWTFNIIGKRLVFFSDCDKPKFVTSGLFKSLTGDDWIRAEEKRKNVFYTKMKSKFIFASNHRPKINRTESDTRRLIYVEVDKVKGPRDKKYESYLWDERIPIINKCMASYIANYPKMGEIDTRGETLEELLAANEEEFVTVFEDYFIHVPFDSQNNKITINKFNHMLTEIFANLRQRNAFKFFVENKYRPLRKTFEKDRVRTRHLVGLREKTNTERNIHKKIHQPMMTKYYNI
jgi:putative DNA primase/helicase